MYEPLETNAEAHDRALFMLRSVAELGLRAARAATACIEAGFAPPDVGLPEPAAPDAAPKPARSATLLTAASLAFARATQAICKAIAAEQDLRNPTTKSGPLAANPLAPNPLAQDPRRALLRDALRDAAKAEPDRAIRTRIARHIDERVDARLHDDPDRQVPIGHILLGIARELGLHIEVSRLPDELLGFVRNRTPPNVPDPPPD